MTETQKPRGRGRPAGAIDAAKPVRAVERAIAVLSCFDEAASDLTLQALADRSGLHKASALRIVSTLLGHGLLHQLNPGGSYSLGFETLKVADALRRQMPLWQQAQPILRAATRDIGETLVLSHRVDAGNFVHLDQADSRHTIDEKPVLGLPLALHAAPAGLAILARDEDADFAAYQRMLPAEHERGNLAALLRKARGGNRTRACLALEAGTMGENAAYAVGFKMADGAMGAFSFSIPETRVSRALAQRCLQFLQDAAAEMEGRRAETAARKTPAAARAR